jgi:threonine dehydratase
VAEPSGAAATAALLQSKEAPGPTVVLLVTGANIPPNILRQAANLERCLLPGHSKER